MAQLRSPGIDRFDDLLQKRTRHADATQINLFFDMGLASGTLIGFCIGTSQEHIGISIAIGTTGGYLIAWLIYDGAKMRDARKINKSIEGRPDTD